MTGELHDRAQKAVENVWFTLIGRASMVAVSLMLIPTLFGLLQWLRALEARQQQYGERIAVVESTVSSDHVSLENTIAGGLVFQSSMGTRMATVEQKALSIDSSLDRIEGKVDDLLKERRQERYKEQ